MGGGRGTEDEEINFHGLIRSINQSINERKHRVPFAALFCPLTQASVGITTPLFRLVRRPSHPATTKTLRTHASLRLSLSLDAGPEPQGRGVATILVHAVAAAN
jgi:hypothetical protein